MLLECGVLPKHPQNSTDAKLPIVVCGVAIQRKHSGLVNAFKCFATSPQRVFQRLQESIATRSARLLVSVTAGP